MISIDPGVHKCGVAEWTTSNKFAKLAYAYVMPTSELATGGGWNSLVIEVPQVYQGKAQKGDPNDLIDLAVAVGKIVGSTREDRVVLVRPRVWKGQVPKLIMCKRVLSKLDTAELAVLGELRYNHNVVDAVGIGLWKLGRL